MKALGTVCDGRGRVPQGFLSLSLTGYLLLGMGAALALSLVLLQIEKSRVRSIKAEYAEFVNRVRVAGELAEKQRVEKESQDKKLKERTDADYKTKLARLERDNKRLRDRTSGNVLPDPSPGSPDPSRVTFDRAEFERAVREFVSEIAGLAQEGDQAVIGLDTAKKWAAER